MADETLISIRVRLMKRTVGGGRERGGEVLEGPTGHQEGRGESLLVTQLVKSSWPMSYDRYKLFP